MQKSFFLRGAVLFLATISPVVVCAQFQPPDPEELKMTSDPKAPGADAVYLEVREIDNDPLHFQTTYARIKVLTEKGKEFATVPVYFRKINTPFSGEYKGGNTEIREIHGRTIHPDGTVIPLVLKPEDLLIVKSGDEQLRQKVFTLPDVEVGSVLEYSYDLSYHDNEFTTPHWEIQRQYFIHKGHFEFAPFPEFMPRSSATGYSGGVLKDDRGRVIKQMLYTGLLPLGTSVKESVTGTYSVDVTDVPPIPKEDWMPPIDTFLYRLSFYYLAAYDSNDFWKSSGKDWSKDVDRFAEPSKAIKAAVDGLVAASDSELDKAKKLYATVQTLDNTDYSRKMTESERKQLKLKAQKHAEDTWAQKSGSSEDIALLYLAMLRAAGLSAHAVKIVDRDRSIFDPSYLDTDQLDSTLVVLNTSGQQTVLDPGEKMCPFGTLNWRHSLAGGLGQSTQGTSFIITPEQKYADNIVRRAGILTLDGQGGVSGQLQISMTGQEALRWRQTALESDESEVRKQFDDELAAIVPNGVQARVDHFDAMADPGANLVATVNISGTLGTATGKRLMLPGFFFETRWSVPFVNEEKRIEPVDMHYGERVTDQITYRFPAGVTVEGAPQDANISWPSHALFVAKSQAQASQITVAQTFTRAFTLAKPEEYPDLRGFYQKVAAADQAQIVLDIAPSGKSN